MVTDASKDTAYVRKAPFHFPTEQDMLTTFRQHDPWCDTNADPAKGILNGVLMGSLLWSATLLLFGVF